MPRKTNYPTNQVVEWSDSDRPGVRQINAELLELYQMPRPVTDEEVEQRIDAYFDACLHGALRPGIESICTALQITRTTFFNWRHGCGCSRERQTIIERAHQFIISFIEQAALSGKLNPVTSIFILKNWANYKNELSLDEPEALTKLNVLESPAQIMARREPPEKPEL